MSGKLTKYNLNKQKEMDNPVDFKNPSIGEVQTLSQGETLSHKLPDHFYNQRFIIQESFTPKKFLWYNYKSKVVRTVIPTGLCKVCGLPALAHE